MFIIGLTGGIASGKSTVSEMFAKHGFPIVDADIISKMLLKRGKPAWKEVKAEFGDEFFMEDGEVDREKIADAIFENRNKRIRLNQITHPGIIKRMVFEAFLLALKGHSCIIFDAPLLYESGPLFYYMHKVIVVRCEAHQQVTRLLLRTKITLSQAQQRVCAQIPLDIKADVADYVIDNSGDVISTQLQVDKIVLDLRRNKFYWRVRLYTFILVSFLIITMIIMVMQIRLVYFRH